MSRVADRDLQHLLRHQRVDHSGEIPRGMPSAQLGPLDAGVEAAKERDPERGPERTAEASATRVALFKSLIPCSVLPGLPLPFLSDVVRKLSLGFSHKRYDVRWDMRLQAV